MAGGKPVGYLQAWLRSSTRYRETNPAGGRKGTRTRDLGVASLTRLPLGHAASEKTNPTRINWSIYKGHYFVGHCSLKKLQLKIAGRKHIINDFIHI